MAELIGVLLLRSFLTHVSTGAFIQSGKIYKNTMIDLRITNRKLWYRATRIIAMYSGHEPKHCERILMNTITESSGCTQRADDPSQATLIALAATLDYVVPKSILALRFPECSSEGIVSMIHREPRIRLLLKNYECQK